jgi:capsid portal protein
MARIKKAVVEEKSDGLQAVAYVIKQTSLSTPQSRQLKDPFQDLYGAGQIIEPPLGSNSPEQLLRLARENAIHSACIEAKVLDAVGRGWDFISTVNERVGDKTKQRLRNQLEEITPDLSFGELLYQAAREQQMIGWSAWEIVREGGEIKAIYPIPAHTLRATKTRGIWVQSKGGQTAYFVEFGRDDLVVDVEDGVLENGKQPRNQANEVLVFKSYSPYSPYYGVPAWISCTPAIAELTAIREFNISFFASGGMADRLVHIRSENAEEAEVIAKVITQSLEESRGQGHTTVVTAGTKDSDVIMRFMTPNGKREGQFQDQYNILVKQVLMAHQVPPYRIGWADVGSMGGSAASREMLRSYRIGAIEPLQSLLEDRLNQTIFGPKGFNLKTVQWRLTDADWKETELDLEIATKLVDMGIFTPNQALVTMGQDRVDDPALDQRRYKGIVLHFEDPERFEEHEEIKDEKMELELENMKNPPKPVIAPGGPPKPAPPPVKKEE